MLRVVPSVQSDRSQSTSLLTVSDMFAARISGWLRRLSLDCHGESPVASIQASSSWHIYTHLLIPLTNIVVSAVTALEKSDWRSMMLTLSLMDAPSATSAAAPAQKPSRRSQQAVGRPRALFASEEQHQRHDENNGTTGLVSVTGPGAGLGQIVQLLVTLAQATLTVSATSTEGLARNTDSDASAALESLIAPSFVQCATMLEQLLSRMTSAVSSPSRELLGAIFVMLKPILELMYPIIGNGSASSTAVDAAVPVKTREAAQRLWVSLTKVFTTLLKSQLQLCDSKTLDLLSPMLIAGLLSKHRAVKNATIETWQTTFGALPPSSSLQYPPQLAEVFTTLLDKLGKDVLALPGFRPAKTALPFQRGPVGVAVAESLAAEPYASPSLAFPLPDDNAEFMAKKSSGIAQVASGSSSSSSSASTASSKKRKDATPSSATVAVSVKQESSDRHASGASWLATSPPGVPVPDIPSAPAATTTKRRKLVDDEADYQHPWISELEDICSSERLDHILPELSVEDIARVQSKLLGVLTILNERLLR
jgi:hypothetical protein